MPLIRVSRYEHWADLDLVTTGLTQVENALKNQGFKEHTGLR